MLRKLRNITRVSNEDAVDLFRQALESLYSSRERAILALHRPRPRLKRSWTRLIYSSHSELISDYIRADADGSGGIDVDELAFVLPHGMTHEDVEQVFSRYCVAEDSRVAEIFRAASGREGFSIKNLDDRVATYEEALKVGQRRKSLVPQANTTNEGETAAATCDASDGMVVTVAGYILLARRLEVQRMAILCVTGMVMCYYFCFMRLVDSILGIFSFTLVEGEYRMTKEMTSAAFTPMHVMMMMVAPVSGFVCIILAPLLILVVLHINRRRHSDTRLRTMFGFILDGYADRYWYWEFVVLSRKLVIATCAHVMGMNMFLQNLLESVVVVCYLIAHCVVWPYDQQILNWLDAAGMLALFCTLQGSLVFWRYMKAEEKNETLKTSVQVIVTVLLFAINGAMLMAFLITVGRYKASDIVNKIRKRVAKKKKKKDSKRLRAEVRSSLARSKQLPASLQGLRAEVSDSGDSGHERHTKMHVNPAHDSVPATALSSINRDGERRIKTRVNPMGAKSTSVAVAAFDSVSSVGERRITTHTNPMGVERTSSHAALRETSPRAVDSEASRGVVVTTNPLVMRLTGARGMSATVIDDVLSMQSANERAASLSPRTGASSSAELNPARGRASTGSPRPASNSERSARELRQAARRKSAIARTGTRRASRMAARRTQSVREAPAGRDEA